MSRLYSQTQCRPDTAKTTPRYSEEEIAQFADRHDKKYGFSFQCSSVYTNAARLPEYHCGPPETLWQT